MLLSQDFWHAPSGRCVILVQLGFFHWKPICEIAYKALCKCTENRRNTYDPALKLDISLYSPTIVWEFNYFIITIFKISCFVLYLWSPGYFQLCLINRLSELSLSYLEYISVLDLNWLSINISLSVPFSFTFTISTLK